MSITNSPRAVVPLTPADQPAPKQSFYEAVGGAETFKRLTEAFYEQVAEDEILRPMYPEEDLVPATRRFRLFLEQYWGGSHTYSEERGHPRLRMRHAPYVIGERERDGGGEPRQSGHAERERRCPSPQDRPTFGGGAPADGDDAGDRRHAAGGTGAAEGSQDAESGQCRDHRERLGDHDQQTRPSRPVTA